MQFYWISLFYSKYFVQDCKNIMKQKKMVKKMTKGNLFELHYLIFDPQEMK